MDENCWLLYSWSVLVHNISQELSNIYSKLDYYNSSHIPVYYEDLKQSALVSNENSEASHGLRWNFAKRRMFEYAKAGYSYDDSLQEVSYEMKHNRASITEHYLA